MEFMNWYSGQLVQSMTTKIIILHCLHYDVSKRIQNTISSFSFLSWKICRKNLSISLKVKHMTFKKSNWVKLHTQWIKWHIFTISPIWKKAFCYHHGMHHKKSFIPWKITVSQKRITGTHETIYYHSIIALVCFIGNVVSKYRQNVFPKFH